MRTVAITLDGVLRKPLDIEAQDVGGSLLYASLVDNFRLVVLGGYDYQADEQFLTMNGLVRHVKLIPLREEDGRDDETRKVRQVQRLKGDGFTFEFVVVADPVVAKRLYAQGFPVLTYLHPAYSAPSFRPDHAGGITAWSELAAEVDYQLKSKAEQRKQAFVQ